MKTLQIVNYILLFFKKKFTIIRKITPPLIQTIWIKSCRLRKIGQLSFAAAATARIN